MNKASTVRIILIVKVNENWEIRQLDINNAFLNGKLEEDVYMMQLEDFVNKQKPSHVCKLNKALYGLKQAPRAWYDSLKNSLRKWGFQRCKSDCFLFYMTRGTQSLFTLIYVDDILMTGSCKNLVENFVNELNKSFALKDLGELDYFLGIEVSRSKEGMVLTQTKCINDLLERLKLAHLRPCSTPSTVSKSILAYEGNEMENLTLFRSAIGGLHYLSHTRPDIA